MASFEELMKMPATEIKAPQAYPPGSYHVLVEGPPTHGKSSKIQTDFWEFKFKILSPLKDVDQQAYTEQQVQGKTVTAQYYVTENAVWRLNDLLKNCGIDPKGKNLEQMLAEAPGKSVIIKLRHEPAQDGSNRVFHRVADSAHVNSQSA
jgi:hypothetical protein